MKNLGKSIIITCLFILLSACNLQSPVNSDAKGKDIVSQDVDRVGQRIDLAKLPSDPNKPFVNLVTVNIKPEQLSDFLRDLKKYVAVTLEEPGVLDYRIHQSPNDPNVIVLYEVYKDIPAREDHNASKHRIEFFTAVAENEYFAVPATSVTLHQIGLADRR